MDFGNPKMCEVFFDIYEALPRVGPGNAESTLRALAMVGSLPEGALVLDLGCGPGKQTFDLAGALPNAQVLAVDLHQPFLDRLVPACEHFVVYHRFFNGLDNLEIFQQSLPRW